MGAQTGAQTSPLTLQALKGESGGLSCVCRREEKIEDIPFAFFFCRARGPPGATYEVNPGDTMCRIGARHGKTWKQVAADNPHIKNPHLIYPKDRLLL